MLFEDRRSTQSGIENIRQIQILIINDGKCESQKMIDLFLLSYVAEY